MFKSGMDGAIHVLGCMDGAVHVFGCMDGAVHVFGCMDGAVYVFGCMDANIMGDQTWAKYVHTLLHALFQTRSENMQYFHGTTTRLSVYLIYSCTCFHHICNLICKMCPWGMLHTVYMMSSDSQSRLPIQ